MQQFRFLEKRFFGVCNIQVVKMKTCKMNWLMCPTCGNKTRIKVRKDTVLEHFPLFCPKCKQEILINVRQLNISVITEPDA